MKKQHEDMDRNKLKKIKKFAEKYHKGQFRKDNKTPYFRHCENVANLLDTNYEKALAYCHDLLEDTKCDFLELSKLVNSEFTNDILILTHLKSEESYTDYIKNIANYHSSSFSKKACLKVKIADIVSNLSDSPTQKQKEKYFKTLLMFNNIL